MSDTYDILFNVGGAPAAVQAAQSVSGALGDVGGAASGAGGGLGSLVSGFGRFVPVAAVAGAALKAFHVGLEEVAETEKAEQTLRKTGVAAEELGKAMAALDDIELFTGDKVSAAQLYGNILNGRTRELGQYGIKLSETATMEEKLQVIQDLRSRGMALDAAKIGTLTGEWERFKRGMGNALETGTQWVVGSSGVTRALGWINEKVLGLNVEMPKLEGNTKRVAVAFSSTAEVSSKMAGALQSQLGVIKSLQSAIGEAADDTDSRIANAKIDEALANGTMTEPDAIRQRAQNEYDAAEAARQDAANKAERTKALVQQERERIAKMSEDEQRKNKEQISKTARELEDADAAAARELKLRQDRARAAKAELDAKNAQAAKMESEKERADALEREKQAAENNAAKVESAQREADEKKKTAEKLAELDKAVADAYDAADKAFMPDDKKRRDDKGHLLDDKGRRKITSPKSNNELAPLPDRTPKAADNFIIIGEAAKGAEDASKKAADDAAKSVGNVGTAQAKFAETVQTFATSTADRFDAMARELEAQTRRVTSNV